MTSEVFVYLTLPEQVSPVTAGRFELSTGTQGVSVGRFVYGRRYLARSDAVPIDPIELKLEEPETDIQMKLAAPPPGSRP
jgi:serine/threonine-protein kinase HipA